MKKWIIIAVLSFAFYQLVIYANDRMNTEFFEDFYTPNYLSTQDPEPSPWEKIKDFFNDLFSDKDEKFIYR